MPQIAPPDGAATIAEPEPSPTADGAKPSFRLTFPPRVAEFVASQYAPGRMILEYGSGGSTLLAARSGCRVISVESDRAWAARLTTALAPWADMASLHYADIGPTKDWGFPAAHDEHETFHTYPLSVWDRADLGNPDLVLIDGRFRAACLVAVLLRARRPTTVLIDDYARRHHYHGVERLARKEEMIGRMAHFTVTPGPIPPDMVTEAISWFADPR
jgi:hypothetical protein